MRQVGGVPAFCNGVGQVAQRRDGTDLYSLARRRRIVLSRYTGSPGRCMDWERRARSGGMNESDISVMMVCKVGYVAESRGSKGPTDAHHRYISLWVFETPMYPCDLDGTQGKKPVE